MMSWLVEKGGGVVGCRSCMLGMFRRQTSLSRWIERIRGLVGSQRLGKRSASSWLLRPHQCIPLHLTCMLVVHKHSHTNIPLVRGHTPEPASSTRTANRTGVGRGGIVSFHAPLVSVPNKSRSSSARWTHLIPHGSALEMADPCRAASSCEAPTKSTTVLTISPYPSAGCRGQPSVHIFHDVFYK